MSKKQLNTQAVMNELRGQSAFFKDKRPGGQPPRRSGGRAAERSRGREGKRPASQEVERSPDEKAIVEGWDDEMTWKGSHLYTEDERNLFDQIILRLRERHGLETQKRLLARAALRLLAYDFRKLRGKSFIVALLSGRVDKWVERVTSQEAERPGGDEATKPASW